MICGTAGEVPIPTVDRDFEAGWNSACDNIEESGVVYSVALKRYKEALTKGRGGV